MSKKYCYKLLSCRNRDCRICKPLIIEVEQESDYIKGSDSE